MNNLHKIAPNFTDVQKAYQMFWDNRVRFSRSGDTRFEHWIERADNTGYWYTEHFTGETKLWLLSTKRNSKPVDISKMSYIE